jgi:hypothetical protein
MEKAPRGNQKFETTQRALLIEALLPAAVSLPRRRWIFPR